MGDDREPQPLGWDAIDGALSMVYGDQEPMHWGTIVPYALGGPDPLTGLSAFFDDTNGPHWHFITYGLSELYEKESENRDVSGFGFELTFRIAAEPKEDHSKWVSSFLQNLARYTFETGRCFGPGHTMPANGPIRQGDKTAIRAFSFALDPQLGSIETPNGELDFLQIVGLTLDELGAIQMWNASAFLGLIANRNPLLITDLERDLTLLMRIFEAKWSVGLCPRVRLAANFAPTSSLSANRFFRALARCESAHCWLKDLPAEFAVAFLSGARCVFQAIRLWSLSSPESKMVGNFDATHSR